VLKLRVLDQSLFLKLLNKGVRKVSACWPGRGAQHLVEAVLLLLAVVSSPGSEISRRHTVKFTLRSFPVAIATGA
jgi:hypothetical protein